MSMNRKAVSQYVNIMMMCESSKWGTPVREHTPEKSLPMIEEMISFLDKPKIIRFSKKVSIRDVRDRHYLIGLLNSNKK